MISEKRAIRSIQNRPQRLTRLVLLEFRAWQLLLLSAGVGAIWAASLFNWSFVAGRDAFWQFPEGTISGSQNDMAQVLVGYLYYVQSPWRLPLFYVSALGTPAGTNVIFMDVVPIVALAGKVVHSLTGAVINLYGIYLFLCFALPGVTMTLVLIAARVRYALAAIVAAILANGTPALLWQWGHIALMAQFLLIGALALYLFSLKKPAWRSVQIVWIAYLILAYLTNMYIFAMVGITWLCAVIQRRSAGLATTREALGTGALAGAVVTSVIVFAGQFGGGNGLPFARGYGSYSMNLLSPIVPQNSGLFPDAGGIINATGGQYEGFNYLGIGLLLASLLVLPSEVGWLRRNLRQHTSMLIAFIALTTFAISHRVFAGHWLLFELPLPTYIVWALGTFRASGRFFWLVCYAQLAIAIVLGFRRAHPMVALCLVGAAVLQLVDVQPLRKEIITSIAAGPGAEQLNRVKVARLVAGARDLEVAPSVLCTADLEDQSLREKLRRANMDLMLATARMNVPTNTVFSARQGFGVTLLDMIRIPSRAAEMLALQRNHRCEQEVEHARSAGRMDELIVLLSDRPKQEEMAADVSCSALGWARYCVRSEQ